MRRHPVVAMGSATLVLYKAFAFAGVLGRGRLLAGSLVVRADSQPLVRGVLFVDEES